MFGVSRAVFESTLDLLRMPRLPLLAMPVRRVRGDRPTSAQRLQLMRPPRA